MKNDIIDRFDQTSPYKKYRDRFISYDLLLGDKRDDPVAVSAMLDELPAVYEYFSELLSISEDYLSTLEEQYDALTSDMREIVIELLNKERQHDKSKKSPTIDDIKGRFNIIFNKFSSYQNISERKQEIISYYKEYILFWVTKNEEGEINVVEQYRIEEQVT